VYERRKPRHGQNNLLPESALARGRRLSPRDRGLRRFYSGR
jgi:hypothetical protein